MTPERRPGIDVQIQARETMFILDGGDGAELPSGSGGPVLAGPEAIFVAGRVAADAPTLVRIGIGSLGQQGDLVCAYAGELATPDRVVRLLNVTGDALAEVPVKNEVTLVEIFLTDVDEPDEIFVALDAR